MVVIARISPIILVFTFVLLVTCSSGSSETVVPVEATEPTPDYYKISSITMDNASPLTPLWAEDFVNSTNVSPAIAFRWPMTIERELISGSAGYAIGSDQLAGSLTIIGFYNQANAATALDAMKSLALDSFPSPTSITINEIEIAMFFDDEKSVILFQHEQSVYAIASAPLVEDEAKQACEEIIQNDALIRLVLESIDAN